MDKRIAIHVRGDHEGSNSLVVTVGVVETKAGIRSFDFTRQAELMIDAWKYGGYQTEVKVTQANSGSHDLVHYREMLAVLEKAIELGEMIEGWIAVGDYDVALIGRTLQHIDVLSDHEIEVL